MRLPETFHGTTPGRDQIEAQAALRHNASYIKAIRSTPDADTLMQQLPGFEDAHVREAAQRIIKDIY